jgi:RHS repeat-associated protein
VLAVLAETSTPVARRTPRRVPRGPQTRVRGQKLPRVPCTHRARVGGRRRPSENLASVRRLASDAGFYLFDGIDHPLRIKVAATNTTAYYELDLAGNVRGLRASGGASLGGYRYSAFGQTLEDTTSINQPLRWKARWFSNVAGGTYDMRARQWSPELGVFLTVDEFDWHSRRTTLWGWPGQSPARYRDPSGRGPDTLCSMFGWALPGFICDPDPPDPDPPSPPSPGPGGPAPGAGGPGGGGGGGGGGWNGDMCPKDPKPDPCTEGFAECTNPETHTFGNSVCTECLRLCQGQGYWPKTTWSGRSCH